MIYYKERKHIVSTIIITVDTPAVVSELNYVQAGSEKTVRRVICHIRRFFLFLGSHCVHIISFI